ncbi:MAG: hypothetical protein COA31_000680 [Flavobacteriales bacterium]|nr:hypothetical protein [Flavobacteriales bacterium]
MKKVLFITASALLALNIYAKNHPSVQKKFEKELKFEANQFLIEKNQTEFVKISFKIDEAGKVKILEANYSNEKLMKETYKQLSILRFENQQNNDDVYYYNFTFKKL